MLACYLSPSFYFSLFLCISSLILVVHHIVGRFFVIYSDKLCFIIIFIYLHLITYIVWLMSTILLYFSISLIWFLFSFSSFLPSFSLTTYFLVFHFISSNALLVMTLCFFIFVTVLCLIIFTCNMLHCTFI